MFVSHLFDHATQGPWKALRTIQAWASFSSLIGFEVLGFRLEAVTTIHAIEITQSHSSASQPIARDKRSASKDCTLILF